MTKVCSTCGVEKHLSEYGAHKECKFGKRARCKLCHNEANAKWVKNNYEKWKTQQSVRLRKRRQEAKKKGVALYKGTQLREAYGIDLEQYLAMRASQNNSCKICKTPQSKLKRTLAVDHCHKTGQIRDLLCNSCNVGIAFFKEDSMILLSAIEYILRHKEKLNVQKDEEANQKA